MSDISSYELTRNTFWFEKFLKDDACTPCEFVGFDPAAKEKEKKTTLLDGSVKKYFNQIKKKYRDKESIENRL